jgi:glyoxylase-like metal-dependent hydrolase (beta-lactamase superfamily II)
MIPHPHGIVLVECGPGSTLTSLQANLASYGLQLSDVTDVILTHIHLDHAGAAGALAHQGAYIHLHPNGAPHMHEPEKLLSSARRIYGEMMDMLWGEFLPVPQDKLIIHQDNELVEIEGLRFQALDTPGHANHHFVYLYEDVCFSGDIGGVRMPGTRHLRLPMPPPEFLPGEWRNSLELLKSNYRKGRFNRIAPTHFGLFDDPAWHLAAVEDYLDGVENWMEQVLPEEPLLEALNEQFMAWTSQRSLQAGVDQQAINALEAANPSWMSSQGMQRYWRKHRAPEKVSPSAPPT